MINKGLELRYPLWKYWEQWLAVFLPRLRFFKTRRFSKQD